MQWTSELVQDISAACREQDTGAAQVNKALQQLDTVIQQNASAAEENSSTTVELAAQAERMQEMISFFGTNGTDRDHTRQSFAKPTAPAKNAARTETRASKMNVAMRRSNNKPGVPLQLGPDSDDSSFEAFSEGDK